MTRRGDLEIKLRAARAKLGFVRPYFGTAILALVLVESESVDALAVDKWRRLYWSPRFVEAHSVDVLASALKHELTHVLRDHLQRAENLGVGDATFALALACMEAEINDDHRDEINECGGLVHLPDWVIYPDTLDLADNQLWETYYRQLIDSASSIQLGVRIGIVDGGDDGDSSGKKGTSGKKGEGAIVYDCGSGAHGRKRVWDVGAPEVSGVEGVADGDWAEIRRKTAEAICDHQRQYGDVPGEWNDWANATLEPPYVPWDQQLAAGVRTGVAEVSGMVTLSYKRQSRRQGASPDFILPGYRRPLPFVCIVGDASGSMITDLPLVRGLVTDVALGAGARVAFLSTDCKVHGGTQYVEDGRDAELRGLGGTDMGVGIAYALENLMPRPDVIVVVSDCYTPWPAVAPMCRVIVAAIVNDEHDPVLAEIPDWALVIPITRAKLHEASQ